MNLKPYLLQFAEETDSRARSDLVSEYYFDPEDDLLHWRGDPENPPVVDVPGELGHQTKKKNYEKSDENRDDGTWF